MHQKKASGSLFTRCQNQTGGSVATLLIDDIQFFAKKLRSQEEFFHVFNSLLERGHQMVLTSDRYPREIDGLEERLKSRFVWGLTVQVEPPELETRVAILMKKAEAEQVHLDPAVAFFIGERIRSNVRELEGMLIRLTAHCRSKLIYLITHHPQVLLFSDSL